MEPGSAIYMPPRYAEYLRRRAQNGGAISLAVLSALAPAEVGIQLADYMDQRPERSHITLSPNFDVENAGTAIYGSASIFLGPAPGS